MNFHVMNRYVALFSIATETYNNNQVLLEPYMFFPLCFPVALLLVPQLALPCALVPCPGIFPLTVCEADTFEGPPDSSSDASG